MSGHRRSDHPESSAARRAAARHQDPPLIAGGQGRSAEAVADSACWLCWIAVVVAFLAIAWRILV